MKPLQQASINPEGPFPQPEHEGGLPVIPSAIQLPPNMDEDALVAKSRKLNEDFARWWQLVYEPGMVDTQRIIENKPAEGARMGATVIPLAQSVVHTAQARIKAAIRNQQKYVEVLPEYSPFVEQPNDEQRQELERWMNYAIERMPANQLFLDDVIHSAVCFGLGVAELSWRVDEQTEIVTTPFGESEKRWARGHVEAEAVLLDTLAWDPREQHSLMTASWVRRRRMVSANELLRLQQEGIIDKAQEAIEKAPRESGESAATGANVRETDPDARRANMVTGKPLPVINYDDSLFRLDEWWATLSWKEGDEHKSGTWNFWICGDEILLKARPAPYGDLKPFVCFPMLRRPGRLIGNSLVDLIKPALREYESTSAAHKKVKQRIANTPTLNGIGSGLNQKTKLLEENSIINVTDVNQVKLAPIPVEILGALERSMAYLAAEIRQGTPANDQAQGLQQEGVNTATEAQILASGASSRFDWLAGMAAGQFFSEIPRLVHAMNRLYAEPNDLFYSPERGAGDLRLLDPQLLRMNWVFRAGTPVEEAWKRQRVQVIQGILGQLIPLYAQNPQLFVDPRTGKQYSIDLVRMLSEQIFPLVGLNIRGVLAEMPMGPAGPMGQGVQVPPMEASVPSEPGLVPPMMPPTMSPTMPEGMQP